MNETTRESSRALASLVATAVLAAGVWPSLGCYVRRAGVVETSTTVAAVPSPRSHGVAGAPARARASAAQMTAASPTVRVPAGEYRLGATDLPPWVGGVRREWVAAFELEIVEVSAAQYRRCVDAGVCSPAGTRGDACTAGHPELAGHPANCVSRAMAQAYCAFVGRRLPSEDEWEAAARGLDFRLFPWGDSPPQTHTESCASTAGEVPRRTTCRVGESPGDTSASGALDLGGNVAEWVGGAFCEGVWCACLDESSCRTRAPIRGGSFETTTARGLRTAWRAPVDPAQLREDTGFRCAM